MAWAAAFPVRAAPAPPAAAAPTVAPVTVTASRRLRLPEIGAVVGDIKPELQLSPADIQSYGVSTVTELLQELAPETRSDRGRGGESPVVLLNGRRISGFNEIQNIPTEAILRVDILPEEVSLKYGYTADQRVVNIVLRPRFRAITGELQGGGPTEGGQVSGGAEGDLLHIRRDDRLNLDLKYKGSSDLTEADRGLASTLSGGLATPGGAPLLDASGATAPIANARYRTLQPATQSVTGNAVLSRTLVAGISGTFNATLGATTSDSLQGLPDLVFTIPASSPFAPGGAAATLDRPVAGAAPLRQSVDGWTAHLGSTLNRDVGRWRLSLTDAYDHSTTQTRSDAGLDPGPLQALLNAGSPTLNPFAALPSGLAPALPPGKAAALSDAANIQFLANGPLKELPAGSLYASVKVGDTETLFSSRSSRAGLFQAARLSRNDFNVQGNLDIPLTSRGDKVLPVLGDFAINLNAALDQVSGFGSLTTLGGGVNWTPIPGVNLIVSHTNDHAAPTVQQLGNPLVLTPGARLFDYTTGQTVEVTQVSGGNPALTADNRNVFKVGLTLKPIASQQLSITANYVDSRIHHAIATFPAADAQIEAAFPDRFPRDQDGTLEEVDERAVNFAQEDRRELRWGFNYSRPIGPQPTRRFGAFGQGGGDRGGRSGQGRRGGDGARNATAQGSGAGSSPGDGASPPAGPPQPDGPPPDGPPPDSQRGGDRANGAGASGGGGRGGGGRGGSGRGGFNPGGRLQFAVYHTVLFDDRILARPGGPALDLLNGAAAGNTGGAPRQEIEAQAGWTLNGLGARLSADWKSGTTVRSGAAAATGALDFSGLATVNFRLFDNLGQQRSVVQRYPWLRGARLSLNIVNLFDERIRVRDALGQTPLIYQAAYLDPAGRTVTLSVRKLFF